MTSLPKTPSAVPFFNVSSWFCYNIPPWIKCLPHPNLLFLLFWGRVCVQFYLFVNKTHSTQIIVKFPRGPSRPHVLGDFSAGVAATDNFMCEQHEPLSGKHSGLGQNRRSVNKPRLPRLWSVANSGPVKVSPNKRSRDANR